MTTTNNLGITLVEQAQAQKEVTVNQALVRLDAILNAGVITQSLSIPPGSPASGDLYIVGSSGTGDWSGHDGELSYYDQIWRFITPNEGMTLWVNDEDTLYVYDGSAWSAFSGGGGGGGYATVQEEGSDLTTRTKINFVGAGFTAADDAGNSRTNVTMDATLNALAAYNTNGLITQTAADTFTGRTLTGGGGVSVTNGNGVSGNPTLGISAKRTMSIPAAAMRPSSSSGCANLALVVTSANHPDISTLDFDASTAEYAQFWVAMPKGWNEGTVTAQFLWSHASTATNFGVVWGIQGVAVSDDDTLDVAYGTAVTVTDTGGTTSDLYISAETSAVTLAGSPATGDMICMRVYRDATSGSDTLAVDARLHAVKLYFTIDTIDDA